MKLERKREEVRFKTERDPSPAMWDRVISRTVNYNAAVYTCSFSHPTDNIVS